MFAENGVGLVRADNNRKQGWAALKELFKIRPDGFPGIRIFDTCGTLIDCIKSLQHDKNDPNDVMDKPHDITHGPDALRYFAQTYVLPAEPLRDDDFEEDTNGEMDYQTAMCGSGVSRSYVLA
jgi:phage terminase large subunit